jgi:hypothetical protein
VLVPAGARLELPVSCVEQGRWDGSRHREAFRPSPQAADPSLRRVKRAAANALGRPDQGEVWCEVGGRLAGHGVHSASAAMSDLYDGRRGELEKLGRVVRHVDGQVGAVACVAGIPVAVDLVSRFDVFAALLPPLAQGYALDALGARERAPDAELANDFLRGALAAPRTHRPTPGLGVAVELGARALVGAGLEHERELVQLSAFPAGDGRDSAQRSMRIARPSRRAR